MFSSHDKKQYVHSPFISEIITTGTLFMICINNKEYFSKGNFSRKKCAIQYSSACDNAITPYWTGSFLSSLTSKNIIM